MDLIKHLEFFNPVNLDETPVHIIGVGAIGSNVAETLARLGITNFVLYDFDTVVPYNVANQCYFENQVEQPKLTAISDTLKAINSEVDVVLMEEGWKEGMHLDGYVFLCVDNIDIRRKIVEENKYNADVIAMFDFRMGLSDAQHFAADWSDSKQVDNLLESMNFTHEEAKEAQPVSACGTTLSVIPTIRTIVSLGIANFINFVKELPLKKVIVIDAFSFSVIAC